MRSLVVVSLLAAGTVVAEPVRAPFHVTYDADHLDLDGHVLQFQMSRPAEDPHRGGSQRGLIPGPQSPRTCPECRRVRSEPDAH